MLFISIYTWEPDKRDDIIKRRAEQGRLTPEGMKIVGEWVDLQGGRDFVLFEADSDQDMLMASMAWNDLGRWETLPVMDAEDAVKAVTGG